VFIANVLPRTKNIRLGSGVSILPQHHPVNVAVRLAYLDHLSRGRINAGFGQGGVPTDWGLFDLPDPQTQGLMTVESLDMILKLWQTDPPFDFQGDYYHIKLEEGVPEYGIGELLQPYQKPHPPIAMSIIRGRSRAAFMAGQRGYIPLSTNLVHGPTLNEHWETYCNGAADAGKPEPDREIWRVSRSIYIDETNDAAWERAYNGAFGGSFLYLRSLIVAADMLSVLKNDPDMPDDDVTLEYMLKSSCIIGDKDECLRQLHQLYEETGGFGTLLMIAHDWDDKERWLACMETLANEIVPALP
jgi:alkanesulfonate monooxygenase SsuD/methylene tetrahydromethanopterin reductase-like flavin-dependent oxidoreductase (luciferase family)